MDLTKLLKESIVDLDWLEVDPSDLDNVPVEDEIRAIPQLEEAWKSNKSTNLHLVPNVGDYARTISPHMISDQTPSIIDFAKNELMGGKSKKATTESLQKHFSSDDLKIASTQVSKVLAEEGLLGNVYIDPSSFSTCVSAKEKIAKTTKSSKYVIEMPKCTGCIFKAGSNCTLFSKELVSEVPYSASFSHYAALLESTGRKVASTKNPKESLKEAFTRVEEKQPRIASGIIDKGRIEEKTASINVDSLVKKASAQIESGIKIATLEGFLTKNLPTKVAKDIVKLAISESPTITASSFQDCANPLNTYNFSKTAKLVPMDKCAGCVFNRGITCGNLKLSFTVAPEVSTPSKTEYNGSGRIAGTLSASGKTAGIKNIGNSIYTAALKEISLGYTGSELQHRLCQKFTTEQLLDNSEYVKKAIDEQGLLGQYYVDPSVFGSRVSGCIVAADMLHVKRNPAKLVLSKEGFCDGCQFNTNASCGIFRKQIVASFNPSSAFVDKKVGELLHSGKIASSDLKKITKISNPVERLKIATVISRNSPKVAAPTYSNEYELSSDPIDVEYSPTADDFSVDFPQSEISLDESAE